MFLKLLAGRPSNRLVLDGSDGAQQLWNRKTDLLGYLVRFTHVVGGTVRLDRIHAGKFSRTEFRESFVGDLPGPSHTEVKRLPLDKGRQLRNVRVIRLDVIRRNLGQRFRRISAYNPHLVPRATSESWIG